MRLLALILLGSIWMYSCKKEPENTCLPDLVGNVDFQGTITVVGGVPFDLPLKIQAQSCSNITTGTFLNELIVEMDTSGNNQFQLLVESISLSSRFEQTDAITETVRLVLTEPGDYRFRFCVDINNDIEERDETNNCTL